MARIYLLFFTLLLSISLFPSCSSDSQSESDAADAALLDSIAESEATEVPLSIELTAPELLGKWKLASQRVGELFISPSEIDEPVREFKANGEMVLTSNTSEPHTITYTYLNGVVSTLQEGDQLVSYLSADSLILTETVDGVEAEYVFTKLP